MVLYVGIRFVAYAADAIFFLMCLAALAILGGYGLEHGGFLDTTLIGGALGLVALILFVPFAPYSSIWHAIAHEKTSPQDLPKRLGRDRFWSEGTGPPSARRKQPISPPETGFEATRKKYQDLRERDQDEE